MLPYGLLLDSYLQDPLLSSCPAFPSWESIAARRNKPFLSRLLLARVLSEQQKSKLEHSISAAVYTEELKSWCTAVYVFIFIKTRENSIDSSPEW